MRKGLDVPDYDKNRLDYSRIEIDGVDSNTEFSKRT